jgi:hypothetical protein
MTAAGGADPPGRKALVLAVVLAGTFTMVLDVAIVNVAIPSIGDDLHVGSALVTYPRLLPQITRMTTGTAPDDPRFVTEWEAFLRHLGGLLNDKES